MYLIHRESHCRQCGTQLRIGLAAWSLVRHAPGHGSKHRRRGVEKTCRQCGTTSYYRPRTISAWNLTLPMVVLAVATLSSLLLLEVTMQEQDFNTFELRLTMAAALGLVATLATVYLGKCSERKVT